MHRDLAAWPFLTPDERERLERIAHDLVLDKRWEAVQGFTLTTEMTVVIAAHAALLVLHLPEEARAFRTVTTIVVHPSAMVRRGERRGPVPGVVDAGPDWLDGETEHHGPVHLAWDALRSEILHPGRGRNVAIHEFAHRLDMLDDRTDGTPRFTDEADRRYWVAVCQAEYDRLRLEPDPDGLLRDYAAENVAEFFAVASEVFFTRGPLLAERKPRLYDALRRYYGHDTDRWLIAGISPDAGDTAQRG